MSLVKRLLVKESIPAIQQFVIAGIAWLIGYPLTYLLKRKQGLTVVIGRKGHVFSDNSKYYFILATQNAKSDERVVFLTNSRPIREAILDAGGMAVLQPSWLSLWLILRCDILVTDMAEWFNYGAYQLSRGAKLIQIWHGAPLKHIELDVYRKRLSDMSLWMRPLLSLHKRFIGRYPNYDVVVATSQNFIVDAFSNSFNAKRFIPCGYPRNDILLGWPQQNSVSDALLKVNVDENAIKVVQRARENGKKICLYVPTFRKDLTDPFGGGLNLAGLSEFASLKNILIVLKQHPAMQGRNSVSQYENLVEYGALKDVYPAMIYCDILITDYSSIYFDFLLLDRPIVFFAPDLDDYLKNDRDMYFDYEKMTPGKKCYRYAELEQQLEVILNNNGEDAYSDNRAEIRNYTYDFCDNQSGRRLMQAVCDNDVISKSSAV